MAVDTTPASMVKPIDFLALKGILFDIDGTLTDSDLLHFTAFRHLLLEHGYKGHNDGEPITEDFYKHKISGGANDGIMAFLWPEWDNERRIAFCESKEVIFRESAGSKLEPLAGLLELMDWAEARGIRKVAVTNAPKANADMMLAALGIRHRFEAVVLAEDCEFAKPCPHPYLEGLKILGARPEEALVFEDSVAGVTAGVAAGVPTVGILTTQNHATLTAVGASMTVESYDVVMGLIRAAETM